RRYDAIHCRADLLTHVAFLTKGMVPVVSPPLGTPTAGTVPSSALNTDAQRPVPWSKISRPLKSAGARIKVACCTKADNKMADPTSKVNAKEAEQPASDGGTYYAEHDVHHKPHLALHELFREPTGVSANDDGCNPADLLFFHWRRS